MSYLEDAARLASPRAVVCMAWLTAVLCRRRRGGARVAVATSMAHLATELVKPIVSRQRPSWFDESPRRSFPSGHSAVSTAYLASVALMAPPAYRAIALGGAGAGAAAVNVLRVREKEHWLTDVLAGDVIGLLALGAAHMALRATRRADRCPTTRHTGSA